MLASACVFAKRICRAPHFEVVGSLGKPSVDTFRL